MSTYNGWPVTSLPTTPAPKSVEPVYDYIAGASTNPFTGQQQVYDWNASYTGMTVTMPPMDSSDGMTWATALVACKGPISVFVLPEAWGTLLPTGLVPGTYWRLKANSVKWSINDGMVYGVEFVIREAI